MNLSAYLFTVNKNNSFRLNPDELKDVLQDVSVFLIGKSYNNQMTRLQALKHYRRAVDKKIKGETSAQESNYLDQAQAVSDHEIEKERLAAIASLNLNSSQKKILELLVSGFSYKEVRKKLRLSESQLKHQVYNIRAQTAGA